jgi:hypothetical protein
MAGRVKQKGVGAAGVITVERKRSGETRQTLTEGRWRCVAMRDGMLECELKSGGAKRADLTSNLASNHGQLVFDM